MNPSHEPPLLLLLMLLPPLILLPPLLPLPLILLLTPPLVPLLLPPENKTKNTKRVGTLLGGRSYRTVGLFCRNVAPRTSVV